MNDDNKKNISDSGTLPSNLGEQVEEDNKRDSRENDNQSGELDESGTTPDLESDDDVLEQVHEVGLYDKADEEHPEEVGIAQQIEKDEKARWEE